MSFSVCFGKFGFDLLKGLFAGFLVMVAGLGDGITLVVGGLAQFLTQFVVVHFVAVFALHVGAKFLHQFFLEHTHGGDGLLCGLEGTEQVLFRNFFHFAFHHHDVFFRSTHHDVHVGFFHLGECGVNHIFAVDTGNANFRDRTFKRDI